MGRERVATTSPATPQIPQKSTGQVPVGRVSCDDTSSPAVQCAPRSSADGIRDSLESDREWVAPTLTGCSLKFGLTNSCATPLRPRARSGAHSLHPVSLSAVAVPDRNPRTVRRRYSGGSWKPRAGTGQDAMPGDACEHPADRPREDPHRLDGGSETGAVARHFGAASGRCTRGGRVPS